MDFFSLLFLKRKLRLISDCEALQLISRCEHKDFFNIEFSRGSSLILLSSTFFASTWMAFNNKRRRSKNLLHVIKELKLHKNEGIFKEGEKMKGRFKYSKNFS